MNEPAVVAETAAFLVLYKPAGMHSAPLARGAGGTLLDWCAGFFPETLLIRGRKAIEGGLLHRLDRDTAGLVLVARTQAAFDDLHAQQEQGFLIKDYVARCTRRAQAAALPGFPPPPFYSGGPGVIESAFRPFGPGRRAVRPVIAANEFRKEKQANDRGHWYRTEIRESREEKDQRLILSVRLARGFRHQIRCHLAWLGWPIIGDELYGGATESGETLALLAHALSFKDPEKGTWCHFSLDA